MKTTIKIEELFMLILSIYMFSILPFSWWWFLVLILLPDIGMLGYLVNTKVGAVCYNICHHKGIAIAIYLLGIWWHSDVLRLVGVIIFGHASLDRIFGYGLKYLDNFKHTHLGKIGR
ncbi:DUF4260 domain-containing protein [Mangrovimonas spongiae]|uniref:DUF4260 family protein n=1 Tax=Mangrovimonas spongiae TaxID=2494697 RepID=A0A3R9MGW8_9FLAO|nr:DUF4260 domain-containing protein [Mangrovimonas spongiae]RSK41877.1 DUF4260 family protein [Mangrovimonas spongiae]